MHAISVLFVVTLFIQGCAYAISSVVADKADKTVPFAKLQADPDSYKGKLLILGGTIVQTIALKRGTLIEVTQKKLDYWGKPERTDRTGGRFFVFHPGYLDSLVYAAGRNITVAGEVQGTDSPLPGDLHVDDPVLLAGELKLWERDSKSWDKPQWMDPLYDPDSPGRQGW